MHTQPCDVKKWYNHCFFFQGYPVSKTLAEKAAWKFAEENKIDLITVIPTLMAGSSLTSNIPSSIGLATALITGMHLKHEFTLTSVLGAWNPCLGIEFSINYFIWVLHAWHPCLENDFCKSKLCIELLYILVQEKFGNSTTLEFFIFLLSLNAILQGMSSS